MKILFDHQAFSLQRHGGVSRYFRELISHVARLDGCDVEILAPFFVAGNFDRPGPQPRGVALPYSAPAAGAIRAANSFVSRLLSRRRRDIDIYHETYYSMSDAAPRGARRVVTVHDMIHEKFPDSFSPTDSTARVKLHAVRRADHVICVSENTRRDLIELTGIARERTSVISHGPGLASGAGTTRPAAPAGDRPFILYVGQRSGYKNFARLAEALGSSHRFASGFSLTCFGGGAFTDRERELIVMSGLDPHNVRHAEGGDDQLASLYEAASALVYPSLYEGFGIPLLEAMSLGCPVVCSNSSSLPEVVGDAAELFDPSDPESIIAAVWRVLDSSARASELAALGGERQKLFSWTRCARETVEVYQRLA